MTEPRTDFDEPRPCMCRFDSDCLVHGDDALGGDSIDPATGLPTFCHIHPDLWVPCPECPPRADTGELARLREAPDTGARLDVERLARALVAHMGDFEAQPESFDSGPLVAANIARHYALTVQHTEEAAALTDEAQP